VWFLALRWRRRGRLAAGALLLGLAASAALEAAELPSLPGLTFKGQEFTWEAPDGVVRGVLRLPPGSGPFPGMLVSHGKGGTAAAFDASHAAVFVQWGMACVSCAYTHEGRSAEPPSNEGWCPENRRRARRCLEVLAAVEGVDVSRLALFGHSMGGFVTAGLAGDMGSRVRASCVSAAGTTGTSNTEVASPALQEVEGTSAPTILFHGLADTTVSPTQSANLLALLQEKGVPALRVTFPEAGHDIVAAGAKRDEIHAAVKEWLFTHGVLSPPVAPAVNHRPSISRIPDVEAAPGSAVPPIAFAVEDPETPASALTVTARSSNEALLPASAIAISGGDGARTIDLAPRPGETGTATVTVTVDDGERTTATSFVLGVAEALAGNTSPVLQALPDEAIPAGSTLGPRTLVVKDAESAEPSLVLSAASSDTGLVPASAIVFGGQGWGRTLTVTPAPGRTGRATVTVTASDGAASRSTSFVLDVEDDPSRPAITGLAGHVVAPPEGLALTASFLVSDAESDPGDLRVTVVSSNPGLAPASGLSVSGNGVERLLTVTPVPGVEGAATLTLTVSDGSLRASVPLLLVVRDPGSPSAAFPRPRGIFVLDTGGPPTYTTTFGKAVSLRDGAIRDLPFVDGYALRVAWADVEGASGQYDFHVVLNALAKLPEGQKLSLILVPPEPASIVALPGVETWNDGGTLRARPWDPVLRERRRALVSALAAAVANGAPLPGRAGIEVVDPYLPGGFTGIRSPASAALHEIPGYSRERLLDAVRDELSALQDAFPGTFVQVGFWPVKDLDDASYDDVAAWEWLRRRILAEFDGVLRPRVGFFMENLAARRDGPYPGPFVATPVTGFASALFASRDATWSAFQMLGSWARPFNDAHVLNTLNGAPADAMEWAFDAYRAEYHEVYAPDVDDPGFQPALQSWHDFFSRSPSRTEHGDGGTPRPGPGRGIVAVGPAGPR
jgi:dienelactone hydrolase